MRRGVKKNIGREELEEKMDRGYGFVLVDALLVQQLRDSMSKKYLGVYAYENHKLGDERVVVFVRPEHTTQKDG